MLPSTAGSPGALSPVLLPWRLSTDCSCVSSDLPALLSGALTLLKLEKPPVPHSSDSAACDSLCVLWAEPSGWLHAAPSHHGYMQPLKHQCWWFHWVFWFSYFHQSSSEPWQAVTCHAGFTVLDHCPVVLHHCELASNKLVP